jgi:hypothetical protein
MEITNQMNNTRNSVSPKRNTDLLNVRTKCMHVLWTAYTFNLQFLACENEGKNVWTANYGGTGVACVLLFI